MIIERLPKEELVDHTAELVADQDRQIANLKDDRRSLLVAVVVLLSWIALF